MSRTPRRTAQVLSTRRLNILTIRRQKYAAAFVQDDWRVTPKLTVNLGVRYEIWTLRVERNNLQDNFLPGSGQVIFPDNLMPTSIASNLIGSSWGVRIANR